MKSLAALTLCMLSTTALAQPVNPPSSAETVFSLKAANAVCDGIADDTAITQSVVSAWKAAASVNGGRNVLVGMGLGKKCKVVAPLDFTGTLAGSSWNGVIRDLAIYGSFNYLGPIGTLSITNGGNYTTPGTYNNVPLTGGAPGSGCNATVTVAGGTVTNVVPSAPGCGTGYDVGATLSAATADLGGAGTGGLALRVDTLSGGSVIDALGLPLTDWSGLTVEGDCTNIPNALITIGRASNIAASSGTPSQIFNGTRLLGCWKTTAWHNIAAEGVMASSLFIYSSRTTGSHYGLIQDGFNHFNWSSSFIAQQNPIDVPLSFNGDQFHSLSVNVSQSASATPMWIGRTFGNSFYNSYAAGSGTCGAVLFFPSGNPGLLQLYADVHFETSSMVNTWCIKGGNTPANPQLAGMTYKDYSSTVTGNIFKPDANISAITASGLTVQIPVMNAGATVFGSPGIWTVTPNRIEVPIAANYVAPGTQLAGGLICIGNAACYPSGAGATIIGAGSTTFATPSGTNSIRFVGCGPGGGGGGGAQQANAALASGGGAGGGGGCFDKTYKVTDLPATLQIRVGAGGAAGTAAAGATAVGGNGGIGLSTCVSSAAGCTGTVYANGGQGGGGAGGQLAAASGGGASGCSALIAGVAGGSSTGSAAGTACFNGVAGGAGGGGVTNASTLTGSSGAGTANGAVGNIGGSATGGAPAGGGSGGGITAGAAGTPQNGGNGGISAASGTAAAAGGTSGTPTGASATPLGSCLPGGGGAGGYGHNNGTSGAGGAGVRGGGGGGGGSAFNGQAPGAGGAGGDGFLCVIPGYS